MEVQLKEHIAEDATKKPAGAADTASRRRFLGFGAALGGLLTACQPGAEIAEEKGPSALGRPLRTYGERSPKETSQRFLRPGKHAELGSTRTPLQDSHGMITPSGLHFERHHAGIPEIDPAEHKLMIHGMVERPLIFTVEELRRLPSVSQIHFVECAGNGGGEWGAKTAPNAQISHGLASCSEWTGVPLRLLLEEAGVKSGANWLLAEGADACHMQRSVPLDKALDDVIVAYGQNGEAIRPEQGYPVRLVVPGFEGNMNVKWLRRIKVDDTPYMTRNETSKYTELQDDGKAWIFTYPMDAKSVITYPSGGHKLSSPGAHEIRGLAWSGRGTIRRVEISTDNGGTWKDAELQEPRLPMAFTRFRIPWSWEGGDVVIQSRSTDDTGYIQPTTAALIEQRGKKSVYHHNGIKAWKVNADGSVTNADA